MINELLKNFSCKFINGLGFGSGMATAFYILKFRSNHNNLFNGKNKI